MKYTPGPWIFKKAHGLDGFVEAPRAKGMPYALDVCGDDYTGYGDNEQREINMHLIAAAPDLYEACKAIDAWWHSPIRNSQTLEAVICSAKDAIAKAEGTNDRT